MKTQVIPTQIIEQFDEQDREEIHNIIANLRQSYVERLRDATVEFHRAQRHVNRAAHEITRLERHLERIDAFVAKHNIPLGKEK